MEFRLHFHGTYVRSSARSYNGYYIKNGVPIHGQIFVVGPGSASSHDQAPTDTKRGYLSRHRMHFATLKLPLFITLVCCVFQQLDRAPPAFCAFSLDKHEAGAGLSLN